MFQISERAACHTRERKAFGELFRAETPEPAINERHVPLGRYRWPADKVIYLFK